MDKPKEVIKYFIAAVKETLKEKGLKNEEVAIKRNYYKTISLIDSYIKKGFVIKDNYNKDEFGYYLTSVTYRDGRKFMRIKNIDPKFQLRADILNDGHLKKNKLYKFYYWPDFVKKQIEFLNDKKNSAEFIKIEL